MVAGSICRILATDLGSIIDSSANRIRRQLQEDSVGKLARLKIRKPDINQP